jgi:hypothetical protein
MVPVALFLSKAHNLREFQQRIFISEFVRKKLLQDLLTRGRRMTEQQEEEEGHKGRLLLTSTCKGQQYVIHCD